MTTPLDERSELTYLMHANTHIPPTNPLQRSSDDDGTFVGDEPSRHSSNIEVPAGEGCTARTVTHLITDTAYMGKGTESLASPSQTREQASRLDDDLAMLHVERQISSQDDMSRARTRSQSIRRQKWRRPDTINEFDEATNPLQEKTPIYKPPGHPSTKFSKFVKKIHSSSVLVRYFTYITPVVLVILIPLLLGALLFKDAHVGGVSMVWFSVWLEIVWLSLWAGRLLAKCLPAPIGMISSLFTNNDKKWRDMGKQLELPATLFFWWLAIEISFLPTMKNHTINGDKTTKPWQKNMNKLLISFLVGMTLNLVEKIVIHLIAISFHLRTYADRIELNKFQINSLTKLYKFSKERIAMEDSEFESREGPASGARTPAQLVKEAQRNTKEVFSKFGDIAGKVAEDFTGRQVIASNHPHQVILTLLSSTDGSQVLARRLYRTFARDDTETVHSEDLKNAFESDDEADAAFSMFDKDMNGDISMEELEAVCVEIGRERKSITASLKDLDSVVSKLDDVFVFIVIVITILVFVSLTSTSAAGVLTSAGSAVLALSWLFSVTAQEFLQSVIFVFVKHPFDVGDRVKVYGNTGATGTSDDYFVKEIALLYTEFKKMEGHVVQAPNSYLNTLFILNQRRSGALAEAIPIVIKFGTTLDQLEQLRQRLLEFVTAEEREYQSNILTELRDVTEVHSLTLNVVFFYKSNWQNELLRLQRRNKFICAMMIAMQECGIEGPRMRFPGQKESFPIYMQNLAHQHTPGVGHNGTPDNPGGMLGQHSQDEPLVPPLSDGASNVTEHGSALPHRYASISHTGRGRGESMAAMGRRVDFSLGMSNINYSDMPADVFEDRETKLQTKATVVRVTSPSRHSEDRPRASHDSGRSTSVNGRPSHQFGRLQRVNTDSSQAHDRSNHKTRFFSRSRRQDEEAGMGAISEAGYNSAESMSKLEPVNSIALKMSPDHGHMAGDSSFHPLTRTQTETFEMRRMD